MKIFILSLLSPLIFANYWTTQKETSYEIKVLVESFKMDYMTEEEKLSLKNKIKTLDSLLTNLDKKDHYFISKTSIYKWLLKNKPNITVPKSFSLEDFKAKAELDELSPFPRWLLTALKTDSSKLIQAPNYDVYQKALERDPSKVKNLSIHKRAEMIKPWLYLFQREGADQIDLRMMKFHFSILDHVIAQLKVFYQFNNKGIPQGNSKLSFFSFQEGQQADESQNKTLSILDQVIEKHREKNLPVPTGEWTLSDEDSWMPNSEKAEFSKIQKINMENPEPDQDYKAPKNLPKPVDDWVWD